MFQKCQNVPKLFEKLFSKAFSKFLGLLFPFRSIENRAPFETPFFSESEDGIQFLIDS